MICIVAMIIAGILSIFSASYREIAKDAFNCVFKNLTLRKCDSGADQRLKTAITAKMMKFSPKTAGFTFKYFNIISWIFVILLFASVVYSAYGFYNFIQYGNCNGPEANPNSFCIFDPFQNGQKTSTEFSCTGNQEHSINNIKPLNITKDDPTIGPNNAKVTMVVAGCFKCKYTKQEMSVIKKLISNYKDQIKLVYKDFPISSVHPDAPVVSEAAKCASEQGKFWKYSDILFANQDKTNITDLKQYAKDIKLEPLSFNYCLDTHKYKFAVDQEIKDGVAAGIYGTPTIYINNQIFVGPKLYAELNKAIETELKK